MQIKYLIILLINVNFLYYELDEISKRDIDVINTVGKTKDKQYSFMK